MTEREAGCTVLVWMMEEEARAAAATTRLDLNEAEKVEILTRNATVFFQQRSCSEVERKAAEVRVTKEKRGLACPTCCLRVESRIP